MFYLRASTLLLLHSTDPSYSVTHFHEHVLHFSNLTDNLDPRSAAAKQAINTCSKLVQEWTGWVKRDSHSTRLGQVEDNCQPCVTANGEWRRSYIHQLHPRQDKKNWPRSEIWAWNYPKTLWCSIVAGFWYFKLFRGCKNASFTVRMQRTAFSGVY